MKLKNISHVLICNSINTEGIYLSQYHNGIGNVSSAASVEDKLSFTLYLNIKAVDRTSDTTLV